MREHLTIRYRLEGAEVAHLSPPMHDYLSRLFTEGWQLVTATREEVGTFTVLLWREVEPGTAPPRNPPALEPPEYVEQEHRRTGAT